MKYSMISILSLLLGGVFALYLYFNTLTNQKLFYTIESQDLKHYNTGLIVLDIFLNNLTIGLLLSIFGFLSGGLLTVMVLFWNGYLLCSIFIASISQLSIYNVIYYSKHIPLELFAFIMFSNYGLRGFIFYKKLFLHKIDLNILPNYRYFFLPIALLMLASLLEIL